MLTSEWETCINIFMVESGWFPGHTSHMPVFTVYVYCYLFCPESVEYSELGRKCIYLSSTNWTKLPFDFTYIRVVCGYGVYEESITIFNNGILWDALWHCVWAVYSLLPARWPWNQFVFIPDSSCAHSNPRAWVWGEAFKPFLPVTCISKLPD